jgi:hypothetical protein
MTNLHYKRVRSAQLETYYGVCDRHARRKLEEVLEAIGKQKGDPLYFYEFCGYARRPPDEVANIFGWNKERG